MTRGRTSEVLSERDRVRLLRFRQRHEREIGTRVGIPALKTALQAPFSWDTLQRALRGKPISVESYRFIVEFLDRVESPRTPQSAPLDYKSRASGERDEPEETATHRGSR